MEGSTVTIMTFDPLDLAGMEVETHDYNTELMTPVPDVSDSDGLC